MWLNTVTAEKDKCLLLHRLFSPAHQFGHVKMALKVTRYCLCIALLLSRWSSENLFLCLLHFTANWLINKAQLDKKKYIKIKIWNWKMMLCLTISDPTVMSQQTSVSNCFYYMLTIALSVQQIIWCKYLRIFNLNHCSVHLWTTLFSQSKKWAFTSEFTIQTVWWWGELKTGQKIAYYF